MIILFYIILRIQKKNEDVVIITMYDAIGQMVAKVHVKSTMLVPRNTAERVFVLYLDRLLTLIESALELVNGDDATAATVLMRSALECYVDLYNLSRDGEKYLLVLRAMLLENRSAIFHFKTQPHYGYFVEELGESGALKRGKEIAAQLKTALKDATDVYPVIRYSPRNLTILNRFRIADMEERYHTEYTWLSMETHNALESLLVEEGLRRSGEMFDEAQEEISASAVLHLATGFMVDTLKCIAAVFGPDDDLTRGFLHALEDVESD